jgi:hypothetical protein
VIKLEEEEKNPIKEGSLIKKENPIKKEETIGNNYIFIAYNK